MYYLLILKNIFSANEKCKNDDDLEEDEKE